jgi:hypothetical protein
MIIGGIYMEYLGKIHEIALYTLITSVIVMVIGRPHLIYFLFFGCALFFFLLISIIGAVCTKYFDKGEGLTFQSDNVVVIMFAHLAEEILGLVLTPLWFIRDVITDKFDDAWKIFDYVSYYVEVITGLTIIGVVYFFHL